MFRLSLLLLATIYSLSTGLKWMTKAPSATAILTRNQHARYMFAVKSVEDGIQLHQLQQYEKEAVFLRDRVQCWLDGDFIPQPVHLAVAKEVHTQYLVSRLRGVGDLGELMMDIGGQLERVDMSEAFVNAWDVANKVSDLVLVLLDRELARCAGNMSGDYQAAKEYGLLGSGKGRPFMLADTYRAIVQKYSTEFMRYRLLKNFVDGDEDWSDIQLVLEIMLGCRAAPHLTRTIHRPDLAPLTWPSLVSPSTTSPSPSPSSFDGTFVHTNAMTNMYPDFSLLEDEALDAQMKSDLPADSEAAELILEPLLGVEALKWAKMSFSHDKDLQRRLLIVQWLFVQGFLNNSFPQHDRFIPGHQREAMQGYDSVEDDWSNV